LITLDLAAVGYSEAPVLQRLNLRIDPDDRIALLGRNGNGKTTLARLLAAQLAPMDGAMTASGRMRVGYFTQYQVEELDRSETPLQHMTVLMKGATPASVRAQLGRFGFSGPKATTEVGKLSGGERARLALALITREAPHLLILDEPSRGVDIGARQRIHQFIVETARQGVGILLISSELEEVINLSHRSYLLSDGRIFAEEQSSSLTVESALHRVFLEQNQEHPEAAA
ncbi:MAG: ATP-binding cassette domain-containing protein, partial [Devosia sp.]